jgi:hypothetical protein
MKFDLKERELRKRKEEMVEIYYLSNISVTIGKDQMGGTHSMKMRIAWYF